MLVLRAITRCLFLFRLKQSIRLFFVFLCLVSAILSAKNYFIKPKRQRSSTKQVAPSNHALANPSKQYKNDTNNRLLEG